MKWFYAAYARWTGRNHPNAPVTYIQEQLTEKRPLPIGVAEFHDWSDRIISGAGLPATPDSQKYALANDLMHCGPNVAYEADIYFIHRLRKFAVNQVADQVRKDMYAAAKARAEAEENAKNAQQNEGEVTPPQVPTDGNVLEIKRV